MSLGAEPVERAGARGIGVLNESSLHAGLKEWYAQPGDLLEAVVDGYVVDLVRGELLIEIQTGSFTAIRSKLRDLLVRHPVRLVYPLATRRQIVHVAPDTGEILGRRRSPRHGRPIELFDELVGIPDLINDPGFTLDVVLIEQEETRCADGKGSWRRGRVSTVDRRLLRVVDVIHFGEAASLARLLPDGLAQPFTNRMLSAEAAIPLRLARRATYCLRRMGCLAEVGRQGRERLFAQPCGGAEQPSAGRCVSSAERAGSSTEPRRESDP